MVNFHKQMKITAESIVIWTIIDLEEDIMVLNNVTKFHKIQNKSIQLRVRTALDKPTYACMYVKYGRTG